MLEQVAKGRERKTGAGLPSTKLNPSKSSRITSLSQCSDSCADTQIHRNNTAMSYKTALLALLPPVSDLGLPLFFTCMQVPRCHAREGSDHGQQSGGKGKELRCLSCGQGRSHAALCMTSRRVRCMTGTRISAHLPSSRCSEVRTRLLTQKKPDGRTMTGSLPTEYDAAPQRQAVTCASNRPSPRMDRT
jgi:hypothetical protein